MAIPCSPARSPAEERRIVEELEADAVKDRKEGDLYFIVSSRWWRDWQSYVRADEFSQSPTILANETSCINPCKPGQIDNRELIEKDTDEENELIVSKHLMEGQDFTLVPQIVWEMLMEWYKGGPALPRKLIAKQGLHEKNWMVEVHPILLQLVDARDNSRRRIRMSRKTTVNELYNTVAALFKQERFKIRIWDHFEKRKQNELLNFEEMIEEALIMDQEILFEVLSDEPSISGDRSESAGSSLAFVPQSGASITMPGGPDVSNGQLRNSIPDSFQGNDLCSTAKRSNGGDLVEKSSAVVDIKGLTGLHNLGNTCFMNSAIQCLVHTPPLVDYFLRDYSEEINVDNPLGLHGALAIAFGELLRKLWSSGNTPIAPRAFKSKLALFAPQFSGYNQHDSQELLAFLLDGLHEDLNRVKKKPYIETKDEECCPDEEFAKECWENHKARNDSVIVDVCQGQYKSTLVCPVCSKVSVTFDPFMYLSLPLPSASFRTLNITVFYGDGSALPMPYSVTVPKHGCIKDLLQTLTATCCFKSDKAILLAEVYGHVIYRYFENPSQLLSDIRNQDRIVAYILPKEHEKLLRIEIMHHDKGDLDNQSNLYNKLMGTPLVTCIAYGSERREIYQAATRTVLKPFIRREVFPSEQSETLKRNGYGLALNGVCLEDEQPCVSNGNNALHNIRSEQDRVPVFQLSLTDPRGMTMKPIDDDSLSHDSCVRLLLGWSADEHTLYDSSYLDGLPEACKPVSIFSLKKSKLEAPSLFSCLDAFLKEEPLGPDDMWYCPRCKKHRQATKKLDLWKLPDILVIHLKRFSYSRFFKNKLDTFVNFPINNFDLSTYLNQELSTGLSSVYELYAVSNHYGGLGGGHYTAYAKLIDENRWYHFDDSYVFPLNRDSVRTSAAYVLFYRRVPAHSVTNTGES